MMIVVAMTGAWWLLKTIFRPRQSDRAIKSEI